MIFFRCITNARQNLILIIGAREAFMTGGPETLLADIAAVQPTVLATVPRVLMKMHAEYQKKVPKMKCMRQMLQKCIDVKNAEQSKGKFNHCSLADTMFFKKFRQLLGGKICLLVSGGAPLDTEISRFFRAALGCPLVKGYGSTETTAVLCATPIGQWENGCVGAVSYGMEVKLSDVPDMGIVFAQDRIGEVCARGVCCTKGYYEDPENTKALFDNEGWLRTGDVGMWTSKGELKLVDRCKNMFKLTQGEYIAVEKVEGVYQSCHLVLYVFVDGDATRSYSVAVVCPDMNILREELANMIGRRSSLINTLPSSKDISDEELCKRKDVRKFVLSQMNAVGKERELKGFEMAKSIHLTTKPFTIENGLLTPTLKIARFRARAEFKKVIQELYEEGELV
ncbi:long-chain acyl-CoA synthetase [Paragonimus westermani]|uniref:long-chain-fatty-acid--CoA ligase n=1 Tax=Paragonimus westermani TaxID=34504 RepID=A0A5J4NT99_9TREM|nr:long-chain acyl-CoA synthetase [Paragonimus westermani]